MSGQIVDASLVPAPKQRNTEGEKQAVKEGKSAREIWRNEPAKAAQKDVDARWTLKIGGKVRYRPDGTPLPMIATPVFGYMSIGSDWEPWIGVQTGVWLTSDDCRARLALFHEGNQRLGENHAFVVTDPSGIGRRVRP